MRQFFKWLSHAVVFPILYRIACLAPVKKGRIVFADGHHDTLPYCMRPVWETLDGEIYEKIPFFHDYSHCGYFRALGIMASFMHLYATAEVVFLCDTFLPAASCRKRKGTTVVQLWHSCGLLKKIGFDTEEDAGRGRFRIDAYRNTDLLTVSGTRLVPELSRAMGLPERCIVPLGSCKTDPYFSESFLQEQKEALLRQFPESAGKPLVLWLPTFRGEAGRGTVSGAAEIARVQEECADSVFLLQKLHDCIRGADVQARCSIPAECLLPAADLVITDYSSLYYDALLLGKPVILFTSDYSDYEENRGFYIPYGSLPGRRAESYEELKQAIAQFPAWYDDAMRGEMRRQIELYAERCDGHAVERIVSACGLTAGRGQPDVVRDRDQRD